MVILNVVLGYGAEGAEADVQQHVNDGYSLFAYIIQKLGSEVQPGRGSSGGAVFFCVYRLIALLTGGPLGYIGRQRHFAGPIQYFFEYSIVVQAYYSAPVLGAIEDSCGKLVVYLEGEPGLCPPSGADKAFPAVFVEATEQQKLHCAAGIIPIGVEPRGYDPGDIAHQNVSGPEVIQYVGKYTVPYSLICPVIDQQSRCAADSRRGLGYQFFGQIVEKVACFQDVISP